MKKVEMYKCEICNKVYELEREAVKCESEGKEEPLMSLGQEADYLIKMSGGWDDFWIPTVATKVEDRCHYIYYEFSEEDEDGDLFPRGYAYGNEEFKKNVVIR